MKKFSLIFCFALLGIFAFQLLDYAQGIKDKNSDSLAFQIAPQPLNHHQTQRLGINLGVNTFWGAGQLLNNILWDPSFEGYCDRILVLTTGNDSQSFTDEKGWGYVDGYWNQASFTINTGHSAGVKGTITRSVQANAEGLPQYFTDTPLPPLEKQDVIVLTKTVTDQPLYGTWRSETPTKIKIDQTTKRPGSPGKQSLVLLAGPHWDTRAALNSYFDTLNKAGKLLLVEGEWQLKFWAKADQQDSTLTIEFSRSNGLPAFFKKIVELTSDWQEYTFNFIGQDEGGAEALNFSLVANGNDSQVWLDDLWLGAIQSGPSTFRTEVITALKKIQPSYIRSTEPADTLENWLAEDFARKSFTTHIYSTTNQNYTYSLSQFLDLCQEVKANPWIILPVTLTEAEYKQIGAFLAEKAPKERFDTVIVELGNESWNWMFRAIDIPYAKSYGAVFEKAIPALKQAAGPTVNLITFANGQSDSVDNTRLFLEATPSADGVDLAPYCFKKLDTGLSEAQSLDVEFIVDSENQIQLNAQQIRAAHKKLAIYEVNLHTTEGSATTGELRPYVGGAVAGTALAQRLIYSLLQGADPIILYVLAGYEATTDTSHATIPLWGIMRDLSPTNRFRPTGLTMRMLNSTILPTMHSIHSLKPGESNENVNLTMVAFQSAQRWSAAIASSNNEDRELTFNFPEDGRQLPAYLLTLQADTIFADNEETEQVTIQATRLSPQQRAVTFTVPAYGFVTLTSSLPEDIKIK